MEEHPLESLAKLIFSLSGLGALGIIGYQIVYWLRYAEWQPRSAYLVLIWLDLPRPHIPQLVGLQLISDWILDDTPLWLVFVIFGGFIYLVIDSIGKDQRGRWHAKD